MKATMKQNQDGTYQYILERNDGSIEIARKSSKRTFKYMLVGRSNKSKGAIKDGADWFFIAMGNNPKNIINSWKYLYTHCDKEIINIEQA